MKTNKILNSFVLAMIVLIGISSCKKDDQVVIKPTITDLEVGHENNKTGYPGHDIHLEAEIFAPGKIKDISIEIHSAEHEEGWSLNKTFTQGYTGSKNVDFHEHIDIPEDAAPGEYHLHIVVTDQEGNATKEESDLILIVDPDLPSIAGLKVKYEGNGQLHVEGKITASNILKEINIEVHGKSYEKNFSVSGSYQGVKTFDLHEHIDISDAPHGHYHIHIKIEDVSGKEIEFEDHFDKE